MRTFWLPMGVLGVVGLVFAGCGGDSSETPSTGAKGGSAGKAGGAGKGGSAGKGGTSGASKGGTGGSKAGKGGGGGTGGSKGGTGGSGGTGASTGAGEAGVTSTSGTGGGGRGGSGGNAGSGAEAGDAGEPGAGAGAGGQSSGNASVGCVTGGDSEWANVVAFIPCTSAVSDAAGLSTITPYNSPTVSSTPAGAPGGASCALGNASNYNTAVGFDIALPSALGTGDFTVELAVYQTAYADTSDVQSNILVANNTYPPLAMAFPTFFSENTNHVQFVGGSGITVFKDTGSALSTWQQYAASRVSGTTYLFRNGTLLTSFPDTTDYSGTTVNVSHQANGTYNALMGSIGQIRITKGLGRYVTSYTACSDGFASGS